MRKSSLLFYAIAAGILVFGCFGCSDSDDDRAFNTPVVFVHGQFGSAQQFETQAMRFTSNGYPQDRLFAFEYDTSQETNPLEALDAFIDEVLEETEAAQVYAIGHSRGTTVWTSYLEDPSFDGPSKVEKYVNIDGRSPEALPGGVPTIGIWGEWNTAGSGYNRNDDQDAQIGPNPEDNFYFGDKSHTEVATSAEAFAVMYEFLTGEAATNTDVVPEAPEDVTVAGRAVLFPENLGYEGGRLEIWEIDPSTGQRSSSTPIHSIEPLGEDGAFGPVPLNGLKHYEFALRRSPNTTIAFETVHHFYAELFQRSDHFFRLQTSEPGQSIEAFLPFDENATGFVVQRMREFWGDQGSESDALEIDGLDVLTPTTSPRARGDGSGVNLAVFVLDEGSDGMTDLEKGELFPFNMLTFLTGVDVFVAAAPDASGTVSVSLTTRGGAQTVLNVPNWPSSSDRVSLQFWDYVPSPR